MKFLIDVTYQEHTPESVADGDFSDSGFVVEDQVYTLRELIRFIKDGAFRREGRTSWMSTTPDTVCLATNTQRSENLHVKRLP